MTEGDHQAVVDDDVPSVPEDFRVCDAQTANWVVRKVTEARKYAERVRAWAAVEVRRAERDEQFFLDRFGRDLEDWCRGQIAASSDRRRSLNLPAGRIGFRLNRPILDIHDSGALLEWCRRHLPSAIMVAERVAKSPLQDHFAATGEIPAGAVFQQSRDRFFIERSNSGPPYSQSGIAPEAPPAGQKVAD